MQINKRQAITAALEIGSTALCNGLKVKVLAPKQFAVDHDAVIFNPVVVFKNDEFHFYFNFIHEFCSESSFTNGDSLFMKDFSLYYRVNGVYDKIPLYYDGCRMFKHSAKSGSQFLAWTRYAYKVFYSMNSEDSLKIFEALAYENIDNIRMRYDGKELQLPEESLFKFNEALLFYINVISADYKINNGSYSTKNNDGAYSKTL